MSDNRLPLLREELEFKRARKVVVLSNYDPFKYPADLDAARQHGLAKRVCKTIQKDYNGPVCQCCLLPIDNEQIPLCTPLKNIVHIGVCYPLYFQTIKLLVVLLTVHFICSGLAEFVLNLSGDHCYEVHNNSNICKLSIMNVLDLQQLSPLQIQNVLNIVFVFVAIVAIQAMKFKLLLSRLKMIEFEDEPADYSVLLKGLPKDITLYDIQEFMNQQLNNLAVDPTIVKIYLIYDGKQYLQLYQKQREVYDHKLALEQTYKKLMLNAGMVPIDKRVAYMKKCEGIQEEIGEDENTVQQIEAEISQYEMAFEIMREDLLHGHTGADVIAPQKQVRFSGKCIVTLNSRASAQKLAKHYKLTTHEKLLYKVQELLKLDSEYKKVYKGHIIKVTMAPEPSDIIYANMGSEKITKLRSRIFGALIITANLVLVFLILTFSKKLFSEIKTESKTPLIYSFIMSITVGMFNSILGRIIRYFADDQFYTRQSSYYFNVTKRLLAANLINMVLTTLFANFVSFYLFNSKTSETYTNVPLNFTGLINDFFFISATNPLLSCIFTFFDYRYAHRLYKRWKITYQFPATQAQANLYFEEQPVDMAQRYSHVFRCVLFTAIVSPIIPNAVLISLAVLGLIYWNDKYLILRRYTCRFKLGFDLPKKMMGILDLYPVFIAVSNTLLMYVPIRADKNNHVFSQQSPTFFYVSLGITLGVLVIYFSPTALIFRLFKKIFQDSLSNNSRNNFSKSYKEREFEFVEDYSHHYPCFRVSKMKRKVSDFAEETEPLSPRKKALLSQTNKSPSKSVLGMIRDYINNRKYNIRP